MFFWGTFPWPKWSLCFSAWLSLTLWSQLHQSLESLQRESGGKNKVPIVSVGLGLCGNWLGAIELDVTKNYVSLLILWNFEPGKFTSCSGDINVQQILRYGFSLKHSWHPTPVLAFPTEMVYKEQAGCLPISFSMDHSNNTHCRTAGKSQKLTTILYLKSLKSQSLAESKKKVAFYRAEKFISITHPQKGLIAVVVW